MIDLIKKLELNPKQTLRAGVTVEQVIPAILNEKTLAKASISLGIGRTTLTNICTELFPDKTGKQSWEQYLYNKAGLKRCSRCNQVKDLKDYRPDRQRGLHPYCSPCLTLYGQERYQENKEQHLQWNRNWRINNPEAAKAISAKYRANKNRALTNDANLSVIKAIYKDCPAEHDVDHIIPLSKGGLHHEENLCYLPSALNAAKKDKLPEEVPHIMQFAIYPNLEAYL